jgi:gliding motility associated protien GldN
MKKFILFFAIVLTATLLKAQPLDGVYKKIHVQNARVIPYSSLREADVMFCKRIWRKIDFREKVNLPFSSPQSPLITFLLNAIANGELTAYQGLDEEFQRPMTPEEVASIGIKTITVSDTDPITGEVTEKTVEQKPNYNDDVIELRVKEDWFFDKQRSIWEARIIGICPAIVNRDQEGNARGVQPMFWVYFPEAREVLVNAEVVNRHNDGARLSFDDVFVKRMFNSYIYKESNERDRSIAEYAQGLNALYESERIKTELFNYEHDLWEY